MIIKYPGFLFIGLLLLCFTACSKKWTDQIRKGAIQEDSFMETVQLEVQNGLVFLPVQLKGKTYRFLFDTGAPLSVSKEIQQELDFSKVSKSFISDSDRNRKQVDWVEVDQFQIGSISFLKQVAFVGDFTSNPILECLNIDGIIGSNLSRQCNWLIDHSKQACTFSSLNKEVECDDCVSLPFTTDQQYNLFLNINVGQAKIRNILLDYGSNGTLSLEGRFFTKLEGQGLIGDFFSEEGFQQRGIVGKAVPMNRKLYLSDSVSWAGITIDDVLIQTSKSTSIGTGLLSRFLVHIDWSKRQLHLKKREDLPKKNKRTPGFKFGYNDEEGIYVQSVMLESDAYRQGLRPKMKVLQLDTLDFTGKHTFCDYVAYTSGQEAFLRVVKDSTSNLELSCSQLNF